jgi:hypothetical protein
MIHLVKKAAYQPPLRELNIPAQEYFRRTCEKSYREKEEEMAGSETGFLTSGY